MPTRDFVQNPPFENETYYQLLGVEPSAELQSIKKAYRDLALRSHPDKPEGQEDIFKKLNEAYECLSNPLKRNDYNRKIISEQIENAKKQAPEHKAEPCSLEKEDWNVFEQIARKILRVINEQKEQLYIGPSHLVRRADLQNANTLYEIGSPNEEDRSENLNEEERSLFDSCIDFLRRRCDESAAKALSKANNSAKPSRMADFICAESEPQKLNTSLDRLHSRLRYRVRELKKLTGLLRNQSLETIDQWLKEFAELRNYLLYFKAITKENFSNVSPCISCTKEGPLQITFYPRRYNPELNADYPRQMDLLIQWFKNNYSLSLAGKGALSISWHTILSAPVKPDEDGMKAIIAFEVQKRKFEHHIESLIENANNDDKDVNAQIRQLNSFQAELATIEECHFKRREESTLMHAIKLGANLEVVQALVGLGCDPNYGIKNQNGQFIKHVFYEAVQYSSLEVVDYLYEHLGQPILDNFSNANQESILFLSFKNVELPTMEFYVNQKTFVTAGLHFNDIGRESYLERLSVFAYLVQKGATRMQGLRSYNSSYEEVDKEKMKRVISQIRASFRPNHPDASPLKVIEEVRGILNAQEQNKQKKQSNSSQSTALILSALASDTAVILHTARPKPSEPERKDDAVYGMVPVMHLSYERKKKQTDSNGPDWRGFLRWV